MSHWLHFLCVPLASKHQLLQNCIGVKLSMVLWLKFFLITYSNICQDLHCVNKKIDECNRQLLML